MEMPRGGEAGNEVLHGAGVFQQFSGYGVGESRFR
jgi:hypothetical protein